MTIGVDTYITVAEADAVLSSRYRSGNAACGRWNEIDEEGKALFLRLACQSLETLPWQNEKALPDQVLSFPRVGWGDSRHLAKVPEQIKIAQAEYALWLSDEASRDQEDKRRELQEQGIKSFSLGDLSESYDTKTAKSGALQCAKVAFLTHRYLNGGYTTC